MECRLKVKKCGGCPMLGLDYAEQLKQKEAAVRKLVGKYGPVAPIRGAENPCHYRNKVISTFAAGPGGKLVSGIYAAGTHKVLPVESCLLQDEVLDTVMQAVRAAASTCRYQPYNEDKGTGLVRHGTYSKKSPYNTCTPEGVDECVSWGDYFYMEALTRLTKDWELYW